MTFVIEVTYPDHRNLTASPSYAPQWFDAEDAEQAVQVYKREAEPEHFDMGWGVEELGKGHKLIHKDKTTGKTVVCKELAGVLAGAVG
jgi:hypothetical protein